MTTIFTIHNLAYQGNFPARLARAARAGPGTAVDGRARVLGADQPAQGRHRVFRQHHDRQPDLRAGDSDQGVRRPGSTACLRPGPPISTASSTASTPIDGIRRRDPYPAGALRRAQPREERGREARARRVCCARGTPFERFARPLSASSRAWSIRRASISSRSWLPNLPGYGQLCGARHGRSAVREDVARSGRAAYPEPLCRENRVRRVAGASDRGRGRHLPDALAVRALRPEPDVQHALRDRARRAGHRRARRHRYGLQ